MTRVMLLALLASVWAGPAMAGEPQQPGTSDGAMALQKLAASEEILVGFAQLGVVTTAARAQQAPPAAPRPSLTRRRRGGTMVGYVDDAIVESKVRLRFDAAFHNTAPDRAEFFYAKCGCYSGLPVGHPAYDPDAPGPLLGAVSDLNFQQFMVEAEYAVMPRVSVFGVLPLRRIQPQGFFGGTGPGFTNQGGTGDIRAGIKLGLADTADAGLTAKFQAYFPTGDPRKGLGTDHASFEPSLLLHNRLAENVNLESQVGVWLPIGGAAPVPTAADGRFAGRVFYYGVGPSFVVYDRNRVQFAPVVELVGWHVVNGNESVGLDASGTNIVNLKMGGRLTYDAGSIYVGYGHALTDKTWYDDIVRVEYRYTF
jgi:hypothetical protein